MSEEEAIVLPFPRRRVRDCENCTHVLFGSNGLFCREINMDLWDGKAALDCELFERD